MKQEIKLEEKTNTILIKKKKQIIANYSKK